MVLGLFAQAQEDAEKLFSEANTFYKEANYTRAVGVYLSIEEQGFVNADLFFNTGNCYYKMNQVAPAIYYYEKALKVDPGHEDARFNLEFAQRMTIDVIETLPETFGQKFARKIIQPLSYETWGLIAVVFSWLMALFFWRYYFSGRSRIKLLFFNLSLGCLLGMALSLGFAYSNQRTVELERPAIVFAKKAVVSNAPSLGGELVFELHEGTKVQVLDALDDWKKIRIADGQTGWISSTSIKEI